MKTINRCWILVFLLISLGACNDEWQEEQYEQYISFKAPINANGVTPIYVRYNADDKTTYRLPLVVSGTTMNSTDRNVHIAVDTDTLRELNQAHFSTREELWFQPLQEDKYEFAETVKIPAGSYTALLDVNFNLKDIDMVTKWVLPLTIVDDPSYGYVSNPRLNYAKALLRVIPFNDYSGSYETSSMEVFFRNDDGTVDKRPMVANTRTAYVVDENTVFFYAGLMSEELEERSIYKIYVRFHEEGQTLDIWPENDKIGFKLYGNPGYSITEFMDETLPYLKHRYVTFTVEYDFNDITSDENIAVPYKVKGSLTLGRNINTQMPDEDQAIEW